MAASVRRGNGIPSDHPGRQANSDALVAPDFLELAKETRRLRAFIARFRGAKFFEQFALARGEAGWGFDIDLDDKVALPPTIQHRHARAALADLLA